MPAIQDSWVQVMKPSSRFRLCKIDEYPQTYAQGSPWPPETIPAPSYTLGLHDVLFDQQGPQAPSSREEICDYAFSFIGNHPVLTILLQYHGCGSIYPDQGFPVPRYMDRRLLRTQQQGMSNVGLLQFMKRMRQTWHSRLAFGNILL